LLCKSEESYKAYQLCTSGTFDDFVADRPLYEPYRLRLSVAQALKRRSQEQYSNSLNNQLEKITSELHKFDQFISRGLDAGGVMHQEVIRGFHHFTQKLATDLEHLEECLVENAFKSGFQDKDNVSLRVQFDQFRGNSLEKESSHVVEQLDITGNWLNELNDGYKEYAETFPKENKLLHIMLVDDDEFYRNTLIAMFEEEGIDVVGLADGNAAIIKLKHTKPDLILLDYRMPELDGIQALMQIKSNPETKSIPIIMLTGIHERSIVDKSIQAGAADYIVKPSDKKTIITKIYQACR
jgi:CheY-like chemotaxis protein